VNAVELVGVSVALGGARVVDGVSFDVDDGEWIALIGPNGAGNTTLLRALLGHVRHEGSINLFGDNAAKLSRRAVAQRVALVPQVPLMPTYATVAQYVLLGRTPHISYLGSERRGDHDAVASALERRDLVSLAERHLGSLSGGERQRATLARALAQDAPILLLDEPTTSLDVGRQRQVLGLVDELRRDRGLTVISTMHDLTLVGQYGERLLLLDEGKVVADGSAAEVLTRARIATHYGADVEVLDGRERGVVVVPVRLAAKGPTA
jgi:iron complex transport system ATP-binding protein